MIAEQKQLFAELNKAHYGENRKYSSLFLPRILQRESSIPHYNTDEFEKAYQIIKRWADLESKGKLKRKKETTLQGEFITEVFGEALGYTLFSENKEEWNLEPQYGINGGMADAAIGLFRHGEKNPPRAVIELKGPQSNLDRDRSQGRTAVQQCWDYLNAQPKCPWGIVCNYVSFRLYHRDKTPRIYQLFVLQELCRKDVFREFYYIFHHDGLLPDEYGKQPHAEFLLERTSERQQEVGDELYNSYDYNRRKLILHLRKKPFNKSLDEAIHISQKLLDRVIFIAFCEDRDLLPHNSLRRAYTQIPAFHKITNPRWQNFLNLFRSMDKGDKRHNVSPFNGGLFREDSEVDNLELDDSWTDYFESVGQYDFREEVSVDVLGHLFEKSISDISKIRLGGLFDAEFETEVPPKMDKSAERKRKGIYYTPPEFTKFIVYQTIGKIVEERIETISKKYKVTEKQKKTDKPNPELSKYYYACLDELKKIKIVDPACGSGAFLISAYDLLEEKYQDIVEQLVFHEGKKAEQLRDDIPDIILKENIYGIDLSPQAVEITQLALWIRTARWGRSLADLSGNIVCGNSLVSDTEIDNHAIVWEKTFPQVFTRENPGFDCVIGNPPWERMKLQEREFFDAVKPQIASAVNAADRRKLIKQLEKDNPELYERYIAAKEFADNNLDYIRKSGKYPLTGKGDINTYAVFAELAYTIVSPIGLVGLLVPTGIATDHTTKDFFGKLIDSKLLYGLYDFENKAPIFPDVHRSYKFAVLLFGGTKKKFKSADFVFFAHHMEELKDKSRHISLSAKDIKLLNPNTRTCPVFRSQRDAELTKAVYRRVPILIDKNRKKGGNTWGIKFFTMFHQTNDAELFHTAEQLKEMGFKRDGAVWKKGKKKFLPLYEAKMIQMYDHRAASVVVKDENWMRQGQTETTNLVLHQNPEFLVEPRWWVKENHVQKMLDDKTASAFITYKDITSPTNVRTMIASFIPYVAVLNSAPLVFIDESISKQETCCLLANLNSFILDFIARHKVGGVHLNFFIVEQLPIFPPDFYSNKCPWNKKQSLKKWVSDRVLKLTCTSNDMIPLAEAAGFDPPVYKWNSSERAKLMAELDAAYFLLYGVMRDDVEYILSTFSGTQKESDELFDPSDVASKILKNYDILKDKIQNK